MGCYYLTLENPQFVRDSLVSNGDEVLERIKKGQARRFASMDDALQAFEQAQLNIHEYIWLRYRGEVEVAKEEVELSITTETGIRCYGELRGKATYIPTRLIRETEDGHSCQYVYTTPGRIIYNKTIGEALGIVN